MARPSSFTQETADIICARLMEGESLRKICSDENMPDRVTVFRWLNANSEFCNQYVRARDIQADTLADEILEISDDASRDTYKDDDGNERIDHEVVARSRLRVDARKWLAGKLAPKKYGDKITQEVSGIDGNPIETVQMTAEEAYKRMLNGNS